MSLIVNAKDLKGNYFSLEVRGDRIAGLIPQSTSVDKSGARPLDEFGIGQHPPDGDVFDAGGATILPAAVDAHVHSRDPGLTHKETWQTLAAGAFRGGVTAVCDMPNTLPPTMTRAAVLAKAAIAERSGVRFRLLLGVGVANVETVAELLYDRDLPVCALKVFYGKTTGELVYDDLETLGRMLPASGYKPIVFHSEDQCTVDCNHARLVNRLSGRANADFRVHSEIRSSEAAHASTRVILDWARSFGGPVHIAHISTPLEVELVAEARAKGARVTCEVAPHHLIFSTDDYERLGPLVKMNPPLRAPAEVEALRRLFAQGAIEIFATDHAPHLLSEKRVAVEKSPSGVPAVEFFYQTLFYCARTYGLSDEKALQMATSAPAGLFGFPELGELSPGRAADFVRLNFTPRRLAGEEVVSKCGWSPYDGLQVPCDVTGTWCRGVRVGQ